MSYGSRSWRPWVLERDEAMPFFRRAIELGINFFDTADAYSLGVSEEITGAALREFGQLEELVIATKVRMKMGEGPNMVGLSRKHIVQGCEASLRRLGIETIDLYQIHRADARTPMEEILAALDHLVHAGKVRYLGASTMHAWELMKMLSISERRGWARFVSMQPHYNLVYREEEREMLPLCADQGLGVLRGDPGDDGACAHQARGLDRLEQMVGHRGVHREYPGEVEHDQPGAAGADLVQELIGEKTGAVGIEHPDDGQEQEPFP